MTLFQNQVYEANFNYIGQALIKAYDTKKENNESTTELSNLIKCVNEMHMFVVGLKNEVQVLDFKLKIAEGDKLRAIERARKSEKLLENDTTIRRKEL
jgi:hypothetical protein